ncbi:MAG: transglycosylase SLT domain-containing protein [Spirochaetaceae bacterium]|nr:transglycosylase SLT domain-containing protein [Spirochaetaceae bacterium]
MTYATFKKLRKSFFCISIFLGITVYFFGNTSNNKTDSLAQNYNLETTQETVATQENQLLEEETVATQENQLLEEKAVATQENQLLEEEAVATQENQLLEEEAVATEKTAKNPSRQELDIPLIQHPLIEKHLKEFQKPFSINWLKKVLERASPYRPYIRQQLKENNMPLCLEYLPVIESEFKINAKSRSGALGMWQFMENSIQPFLKKNEWIDERLDPWKSTDAAIKKLQDNYNWFKDWELALAAYNYGSGGISRLIKKHDNVNNYWYLVDKGVLTNQTENYVPKFLAIAEIITNEEYYGLDLPKINEEEILNWEEVTVTKSIPITLLAKEMGIDSSILEFLNPSLLRGRTPPATEYQLRVPMGTSESVALIIQEMELPTYEHTYKVVKGDTLWGISRRYGITVQDLCDANNISENGILSIGKILYVPIIK